MATTQIQRTRASVFLLCGATMEAAAGMLIHSTALRPIDMAQCAKEHRSNVNLECMDHDVWIARHETLTNKSCTAIGFCDYAINVQRKL